MKAAVSAAKGERGTCHVDRRTHDRLGLGQLHAGNGRALHPHRRLLTPFDLAPARETACIARPAPERSRHARVRAGPPVPSIGSPDRQMVEACRLRQLHERNGCTTRIISTASSSQGCNALRKNPRNVLSMLGLAAAMIWLRELAMIDVLMPLGPKEQAPSSRSPASQPEQGSCN